MTRPVVVIGPGFIGRTAAAATAAEGRPTVLLSRRPVPPTVGADTRVGDLTDVEALGSAIGPDTDVVFAAGTSVPAADERDPQASTAILQPLIGALEAVRRAPGATFLLVSSGGAIYGEPDRLPVDEDHPQRPLGAYGAAQAAAEGYVGYYARRHGVRATSLRCGNVYGPGQIAGRGQGLVGELINAVQQDRGVEVWGDGSVERDYVHIADLADAIAQLVGRTDLPLALNIGSGRAHSVAEVIAAVSEVMGRPVRVNFGPARSFDVHRIVLDITRLQRLIDFDPLSLHDGVRVTWESMVSDTVA